MVSIDFRQRLQELKCPNKGSIIDHFATLCMMREDLASMGELLTENNYYAIIMGSLPLSYDPYLSALNATSSVLERHLSSDVQSPAPSRHGPGCRAVEAGPSPTLLDGFVGPRARLALNEALSQALQPRLYSTQHVD